MHGNRNNHKGEVFVVVQHKVTLTVDHMGMQQPSI